MPKKQSPKLRTVSKVKPPYPLNEFPANFGLKLGKELIYLLATKNRDTLEGSEWEKIFADCIGAAWKPSNVGLDDVILENCAWGAKTVYGNPETSGSVRLISGRNSPIYSFGESDFFKINTNDLGTQVLEIWNERVSAIRAHYKHLRTVVLIKSKTLSTVCVFEFDTVRYDPELFVWDWNKRKNLEGYDKTTKEHRFTWQPHGSQFTIKETLPDKRLIIKVRKPKHIEKDDFFKLIKFDESWVKVFVKNG